MIESDFNEIFFRFQVIRRKIAKSISDKFGIDVNSIYLTHPTFFSRINNETAKTVHDEYWHPHVDKVFFKSRIHSKYFEIDCFLSSSS